MKHTHKVMSTNQKALELNLDDKKYGTIAEIGAGQEVARLFFAAGAAAGTVAKTMSAYDMQFSDAIYGINSGRYVSKERVQAMMEKEFALIIERVSDKRDKNSRYFSYGSTAAAKRFNQKSECHAWCGIRIQMYPGAEPSDIIVHVRMHDDSVELQQEALGVVGVNLIHSAFYHYEDAKDIIARLTDNLEQDRIEVDSIEFKGPYFEVIDKRAINLHLIRNWKTRAILFDPDGNVTIPAEVLYKKNVLTIRGSFKPVTKLNVDMIEQGFKSFSEFDAVNKENTLVIAEISLNNAKGADLGASEEDIIARIGLLNSLGYTVMVSDYTRFFSLRAYFRQYTQLNIGIVLGVINIHQIFDEGSYKGVEGGMLEGFGKLFPDNTHLFVYPELNDAGEVSDYSKIKLPDHLQHLYQHLLANNFVSGIDTSDTELFSIYSREILKAIKEGNAGWQDKLPEGIAEQIVAKQLFGYTDR